MVSVEAIAIRAVIIHQPHCRVVANCIIPEGFTVPCGRRDTESGHLLQHIIYLVPITITPVIIIGTMVTMYRTVRRIKRKMQNYGASTLRLHVSKIQVRLTVDHANAARGRRGNHTSLSLFLYIKKYYA